jgi:hypothetical protein
MAPRFLTILTSRNLPKIRQPREAEPSIINEKTLPPGEARQSIQAVCGYEVSSLRNAEVRSEINVGDSELASQEPRPWI